MLKLLQQIVGLAIFALGLKLWHNGMGLRVALAILVFGLLVTLNASKREKKEDEDEDW